MKACNMKVSADHVTEQNSFCFHDAYMHDVHSNYLREQM